MSNWVMEIVKVGSYFVIRPPVRIPGDDGVTLRSEDKISTAIGEEYDYPTLSKQSVLSITRDMLANIPEGDTETS